MKNIIIYCAAGLGELTYNYLSLIDKYPVCFCDNAATKENMYCLDLPIYNYEKCKLMYPKSIWFIANSNYGKMSTIKKQLLEEGIEENDIFWSLQIEVILNKQNVYFENILKDKDIVLVGRNSFCEDLKKKFKKKGNTNYIETIIYEKESDQKALQDYVVKHLKSIYFIVTRGCYAKDKFLSKKIYNCLKMSGAVSISERYSSEFGYIEEMKSEGTQLNYDNEEIKTARPVNGRLEIENINTVLYHGGEAFSGTIFFMTIFQKHKNVLFLGYTPLQSILWLLIKEVKSDKIFENPCSIIMWIKEFLIEGESWGELIEDEELFVKEFQETIRNRNSLSARDIFVAIYIAFFYMNGNTYHSTVEPIIYFEPHSNHDLKNIYMQFFLSNFTTVKQLRIVRNPINRIGSIISYNLRNYHKLSYEAIRNFQYWGIEQGVFPGETVRKLG